MSSIRCCSKRTTDFSDFLAIPGCCEGKHSDIPPPQPEKQKVDETVSVKPTSVSNGVEVFGQAASPLMTKPVPATTVTPQTKTAEIVPEFDPEGCTVAPDTVCKRKSCGYLYKNNEISRGDGAEAVCTHHPGVPIFHEGSKGWSEYDSIDNGYLYVISLVVYSHAHHLFYSFLDLIHVKSNTYPCRLL